MYKGLYYIFIVAKNTIEQKKKVVFQMVNHIIFLLFSLYLYRYVYELLPDMQSKIPYTNAVWSMSMYFVVFWLGLRNIERIFRKDILSGNIEMYLLRPIGYIWQKVFVQIGQGLITFISALILSIVVDYFLIGLPQIDTTIIIWVISLIAIFLLSQILTCLIYILCGLSGFWLQDSQPVYLAVSKLIMILGGAWVPIAFFPKWLQVVAEYSPFGASVALSYAMYPNFSEHFIPLILNICFWIIIGTILVYSISKRAMQKLSING
jgi:ABC-2 type transport system permease protein